MKILMHILLILALASAFPAGARACPSCADAVPASSDSDVESNNLPGAFNASIYLMVGVPYAVLGVMCFLIYRGCKKNAAYLQMKQAGDTGHLNSFPSFAAGDRS